MQNKAFSKKWSDLKGMATVAIDTGKKVGTVDDFYFDPTTNSVYALQIKTSLFGHRALLISSISAIGTDAITFASEEALIKENAHEQLRPLSLGSTLPDYHVLSEGGTIIGTISNVLLEAPNSAELCIVAYELAGGLREKLTGHHRTFEASKVMRYGKDVIVIPSAIAEALRSSH